jgi:hypothetical protein
MINYQLDGKGAVVTQSDLTRRGALYTFIAPASQLNARGV